MIFLIEQLQQTLDLIEKETEYLHNPPKTFTAQDYMHILCGHALLMKKIKHAKDLADVILDEARKSGIKRTSF